MVDKIFTDNDLLEEKSYDTKIMEGAGVEPDATYLEQTPVKKRLAEAIEAGGGDYTATLRTITFKNTSSSSYTGYGISIAENGDIHYFHTNIATGKTKTYEMVAKTYNTGFYQQYIPVYSRVQIKLSADSIYGTLISTGEVTIGSITTHWYILKLENESPNNITITFENE